jgi:phosphoglucomutase
LERYEADPTRHDLEPQSALAGLITAADEIGQIQKTTGRSKPTVVT